MARLSLVLHLGVTEGGLAVGAPVDDPVAPVDELLVVERLEDLDHGLVAALVHGEPFPLPIAGGAHLPELLHDGGAVFLPPLPGAFQKALPADVLLGQTLFRQGFHDLHLGGDRGVIRAGEPKHLIPGHALIAGDGVLQRIVQGVAHVELARDVGGRDHDGERGLLRVRLCVEIAALLPFLVPFALYDLMIVGFRHLFHKLLLSQNKSPASSKDEAGARGTTFVKRSLPRFPRSYNAASACGTTRLSAFPPQG